MPFSDPMADGPAIQASALRALRAGQTMVKTLAMVARLPRGRWRHADRADGLLQPDLLLRQRALPRRRQGRRRRRADRRRPAAGGRRRALPAGDAARPSTSSAWRRRPPTTSACRWCSPIRRVSSTTSRSLGITGTASPDTGAGGRGGDKDQAAHHIAGRRRFRREDGRPGARHRRGGRRRRGRLGAGQCAYASRSTATDGRPPRTVSAVTGLVAELSRRRPRRARDGSGVERVEVSELSWISNVVRPEDPQPPRQAGGAAEPLDQVPRDRRDGLPSRPRGEPVRHPRLRLPHADDAPASASAISSTAANGRRSRCPTCRSTRCKFRDERRYTDRLRTRARRPASPMPCSSAPARSRMSRSSPRCRISTSWAARSAWPRARRSSPACETAMERGRPFVVFAASGGARMQEGVLSLMQLPRTTVRGRGTA